MRRADELIARKLAEAYDVGLINRLYTGRGAAWLTPSGEHHALPENPNYWHVQWVKDPANTHKMPAEHVVRFQDGDKEIEAVSTMQNLQRAGWIKKSTPETYEVHASHAGAAVHAIRRHLRAQHPDVKTFKLDTFDDDGKYSATQHHSAAAGAQAVSDVARMRSMDMPRGWDAYGGPSKVDTLATGLAKNSSRAGRLAQKAARKSRQRYESSRADALIRGVLRRLVTEEAGPRPQS